MSILAPAKMRLWIEMWKEEVMASVPIEKLTQKLQDKQIKKGRLQAKTPEKLQTKLEGGGHLL
ncbi:MAG: hypothetical protein A7315_07155 [Candidatus Altiarchaeales archaeon WOR_SM1_79]|nr:MAG: hypothetical protein A7315_07155 [Candidatus Altiarchaeales archaeon WOR_SM1_79]